MSCKNRTENVHLTVSSHRHPSLATNILKPLFPSFVSPKQIISSSSSFSSPRISSSKPISDLRPCFPPPHLSRQQRQFTASIAFNPSRSFDLSLFGDEDDTKVEPPMPSSEGRFDVAIDNDIIRSLDLTPFHNATGITSPLSAEPKEFFERTIGFTINYTRDYPRDPRELSEFPDIRLWSVRLDATYTWLPVLLDWRAGELARYAAMLVRHQMNMKMGVVFNLEALELFIMNKTFIVYSWLKQHNIPKPRLTTSDMARMLGFGVGDKLFDTTDQHPPLK